MDENLILRDGTEDLEENETLDTVTIGPMLNPMWLLVDVPDDSNVGDALDITGTYKDADGDNAGGTFTMAQIAGKGHYAVPFFSRQPQLSVALKVTGVGVNFGEVTVAIATADLYTN